MDYDLGYIDLEEKTLQPLNNPFAPKVLPMPWVHSVTHVSRPDRKFLAPLTGHVSNVRRPSGISGMYDFMAFGYYAA
jgi:hypothetical protein